MNLFFRNKKILSYLLIIPIMISLTFSSLAIRTVYAVDTVPPVPVSDDALRSKFVGVTVMGYTVPAFSLNSIYILVMKTLLSQITDSIVNWINSGFEGGPSFVTDPKRFLLGVGDEIAGEFINGTEWGWVCDPFKLNIKIALTLGMGNFKRQKKCTLTGIIKNFDNFYNGTFKDGGWRAWFELNTNPNANPMSTFLSVEAELRKRVNQGKDIETKKLDWGKGFMSWQDCEAYAVAKEGEPENSGECIKKGPIKTPGTVIEAQLEHTLGTGLRQMELADDIDKIVGALVGQLVKTVLQKGLSSLNSNEGWSGTGSDFAGNETKMMGTCAADTASARTGENVEWLAYVTGGPTDIVPVYKWTGDGITDSIKNNNTTGAKSIKVRYSAIGAKTATLTAKKGNMSITVKCPSIAIIAKDNTEGSCSANQPEIRKGSSVIWTWMPYVWSNELYSTATYEWSGDGIGNTYKTNPITVPYSKAGEKSAGVVVTTEHTESVCSGENNCTEQTSYKHTLYDCGTINVSDEVVNNDIYSCSADKTNALIGQSVLWTARSASGNDAASYNWSGTDGLFGNTKTVETTYTTTGTKSAKVNITLTKGGAPSTINCENSVTVSNSKPFALCSVNPAVGVVDDGTIFTWTATAGGGVGSYKYKWSGTDGLAGSEAATTIKYAKAGTKSAQIIVTSGKESVTAKCDNTAEIYSQ